MLPSNRALLGFVLGLLGLSAKAGVPLPISPFEIPQGAYTAEFLENRDQITVMEFSGNLDRDLAGGQFNAAARAVIAQEFYEHHADNYDFLVVFSDFEYETGDALAFHAGVRNDIQGIGLPIYDNTVLWGSEGKLQSYIDMAALARYELDPSNPEFNLVIDTLGHEVLHRWASFIHFENSDGLVDNSILGRDGAHWSFFLDSNASLEYGADWQDNGDGTYTAVATRYFYSPMDLYLMGFYGPDQVQPLTLLDSPTTEFNATDFPVKGVTIEASPVQVAIDQVIAAEGPRIPSSAESQKEFRFAFIYLVSPDQAPAQEAINGLIDIRRYFAERFSVMTGGKGIAHIFPETTPVELGELSLVTSEDSFRVDGVSIDEGLQWLAQARGDNAFWQDRDGTALRDTLTATAVLRDLTPGYRDPSDVIEWITEQALVNTDDLARVLEITGSTTTAGELASRQNSDGGWSLLPEYDSSPLDTALAVRALMTSSLVSFDSAAALSYWRGSQNSDGGWPSVGGSKSTVRATATVLSALAAMGEQGAETDSALAWLQAQIDGSGGFGDGSASVHETAMVLQTFARYERLTDIDAQAALGFITDRQRVGGHWEGSVYTTAMALRAMQTINLPNLRALSFTTDNDEPVDGELVSLSAIINNDSSIAVTGAQVSFYTGDPANGGLQINDPIIITELPAYGSAVVTTLWDTFDIQGDYELHVSVDPLNNLAERSENDNIATTQLNVSAPSSVAELAVTSADFIISPAQPNRLPTDIAVTASARNLGLVGANAVTARLMRGDEVADETVLDIPARGSVALNFIDTLTDPGDSTYTLVIDPADLIAEVDEANNLAVKTITTQDGVDLEITQAAISSPDTAFLYDDVRFVVSIVNRGTVDAVDIDATFNVLNSLGTTELLTTQISVPAGRTIAREIIWRADVSGITEFQVQLDPNNQLAETVETNNDVVKPIEVIAQAGANVGINFSTINFNPEPALQGFDLIVTAQVSNSGTTVVEGLEVALFNGNPEAGGIEIDRITLPAISAAQESTVTLIWPTTDVVGDQLIYIALDPENNLAEINEGDNVAFREIEVRSLPDLTVAPGSITLNPINPSPGQEVQLTVLVGNLGNQAALDVPLVIEINDNELAGDFRIANIPGNGDGQISVPVTFENQGNNTVRVVVDPNNTISETQTINNAAELNLSVQDGDFFVTEIYVSPDGNGVNDETVMYFSANEVSVLEVAVVSDTGEEILVSEPYQDVLGGSFVWNGKRANGLVAADGEYRLIVRDLQSGLSIGDALVVIDTNRSPLTEAIDTRYGLTRNLSCSVGELYEFVPRPSEEDFGYSTNRNEQRISNAAGNLPGPVYSPDDEFFYFATVFEGVTDPETGFFSQTDRRTQYPTGFYRASSDGTGVTLIASDGAEVEVDGQTLILRTHDIRDVAVSSDGSRVALLVVDTENGSSARKHVVWVVDADGSNLTPVFLNSEPRVGGDWVAAKVMFAGSSNRIAIYEQDVSVLRARLWTAPVSLLPEPVILGEIPFNGVDYPLPTIETSSTGNHALIGYRYWSTEQSEEDIDEEFNGGFGGGVIEDFENQNYTSLIESSRYPVYLVDFEGNTVDQISSNSSAFAWAPDGNRFALGNISASEIQIRGSDNTEIQSIPFGGQIDTDSRPIVLLGLGIPDIDGLYGFFDDITWSPEGTDVAFVFLDYITSITDACLSWDEVRELVPEDNGTISTEVCPGFFRYSSAFNELITDLNGVFTVELISSSVEKIADTFPRAYIPDFGESFHFLTYENGQWVDRGELHFGLEPALQNFDFSSYLPDSNGEYRFRIQQIGHEEAQIDQIKLFSDGSVRKVTNIDSGRDITGLTEHQDNRLADVWSQTVEVELAEVKGDQVIVGLTAREASLSNRNVEPLKFDQLSYYIDGKSSIKFDGEYSELEKQAKHAFQVRARTTTGHPTAYVTGYLGSSDTHLYAALDFGVDNTFDNPDDWGAVEVLTEGGWKRFEIREQINRYGQVTQTDSRLVPFEHKYYEFSIPLKELDAQVGKQITVRFSAYGSAGLIEEPYTAGFEENEFGVLVSDNGYPYLTWRGDGSIYFSDYRRATPPRIEWLVGSDNILVSGEQKVLIDIAEPAEQSRALFELSDGIYSNPSQTGRYLNYFSKSNEGACRIDETNFGEYRQFQSLLNLTVDVRAQQSSGQGGVILYGTASDKNFASWTAEYASADTPDSWNLIAPPETTDVIDSQLTTWAPPSLGSFFIRLTVLDKAGNSRSDITQVNVTDSSSITDIYRQPAYISPNGDNRQDSMTVNFRVLQPVNLQVEILNDAGLQVRSFSESFSVIGAQESIVWDGRDDFGNIVEDGVYRIVVQDFQFFVEVDNTFAQLVPGNDPLVSGTVDLLNQVNGGRNCSQPLDENNEACYQYLDRVLTYDLVETNIGEEVIQVRNIGSSQWADLYSIDRTSTTDALSGSVLIDPTRHGNSEYRVHVTDKAGNSSSVLIGETKAEKVFISEAVMADNVGQLYIDFIDDDLLYSKDVEDEQRRLLNLNNDDLVLLEFTETVRDDVASIELLYRRSQPGESYQALPIRYFSPEKLVAIESDGLASLAPASSVSSLHTGWLIPELSLISAVSISDYSALEGQAALIFSRDEAGLSSQESYFVKVRVITASGDSIDSPSLFLSASNLAFDLFEGVKVNNQTDVEDSTKPEKEVLGFISNIEEKFVKTASLYVSSSDDDRYLQRRLLDEYQVDDTNTVVLSGVQLPSSLQSQGIQAIRQFSFDASDLRSCTRYVLTMELELAGGQIFESSITTDSDCVRVNLTVVPALPESCGIPVDPIFELETEVTIPLDADDSTILGDQISVLTIAYIDELGNELVFDNVNDPTFGLTYSSMFDARDLEAGKHEFFAKILDSEGNEVANAEYLVDYHPAAPSVEITSPIQGQQLCATTFAQDPGLNELLKAIEVNAEISGPSQFFYKLVENPETNNERNIYCSRGEEGFFTRVCDDSDPDFDDYSEGEVQEYFNRQVPSLYNTSDGSKVTVLLPSENVITGESQLRGLAGFANLSGENVNLGLMAYNWSGAKACSNIEISVDAGVNGFSVENAEFGSLAQYISPNSDGISDEFVYQLNVDEFVTVGLEIYSRILDAQGREVRGTFIGVGASGLEFNAGHTSSSWSGELESGSLLPDGEYELVFTATDGCGNIAEDSLIVSIDTTAPGLELVYPVTGDLTGLVIEPVGTVLDTNLASYELKVNQNGTPISIGAGLRNVTQEHVDQGFKLGKWNTFGLSGDFILELSAVDKAGNIAATTETINLSSITELVSELSLTEGVISPNGDGRLETTTLRAKFETDVLASIVITDVVGNQVRSLLTNVAYGAEYASILWDGRDDSDNAVPSGEYLFNVVIQSVQSPGLTEEHPLSVLVDTTVPVVLIENLVDGYLELGGGNSIVGSISDSFMQSYSIDLISSPNNISVQNIAIGDSSVSGLLATLDEFVINEEGLYQVRIVATDTAQNTTSILATMVVDRIPPEVQLTDPKDDSFLSNDSSSLLIKGTIVEANLRSIELGLTADVDGAQREVLYQTNELPATTDLYVWDYSGLADGRYTLDLLAEDLGGLSGAEVASVEIDTTNPEAALDQISPNGYVTGSIAITGTATDLNIASYEVAIAPGGSPSAEQFQPIALGASNLAGGQLTQWVNLPDDGVYTVRLTVVDKAGNSAIDSQQVTVDTTPPNPPSDLFVSFDRETSSSNSQWQSSDSSDVAGYLILRNNQALFSEPLDALTFADLDLIEGQYRYTVIAVDDAGLESEPSNPIDIEVDFTPPITQISRPSSGQLLSGLVDIRGTAFSETDFKSYRLLVGPDETSLTVVTESTLALQGELLAQWNTLNVQSDVPYIIRLEGEDTSGNIGISEVDVLVDNNPPAAVVDLGGTVDNRAVELSWTANTSDSDISGYLVYRNSSLANFDGPVVGDLLPYKLLDPVYTDSDLPDGEYSYIVFAIDNAGNISAASNEYQAVINVGLPHAEIVNVQENDRFEDSQLLIGESEDNDIANVQFSYRPTGTQDWVEIATDTIAPFEVLWDTSAIAYGDYQIRAVATDNFAGVDENPTIVNVAKVDLTSPVAVADLEVTTRGQDVSLSWTVNTTDLDFASYRVYFEDITVAGLEPSLVVEGLTDSSYVHTNLLDSEYRYTVVAVDTAGNESTPSQVLTQVFTPVVEPLFSPITGTSTSIAGSTVPGAIINIDFSGDNNLSINAGVADEFGQFSFSGDWLVLGNNVISVTAQHPNYDSVSRPSEQTVVVSSAPSRVIGVEGTYNTTDDTIDLTWQQNAASEDILGYFVYRNSENIVLPVPQPVQRLTVSDNGNRASRMLTNDTLYWWTWDDQAEVNFKFDERKRFESILVDWDSVSYKAGQLDIYGRAVDDRLILLATIQGEDSAVVQEISLDSPYVTDEIVFQLSGQYFRLEYVEFRARELVSALSYQDTPENGFIDYQVSAVNSFGFEGEKSEVLTIGFGDVTPPDPVTLAAVVNTSSVSLTWEQSAAVDLANYRIYRDGVLIAESTDLSYIDGPLINGSYQYSVRAVDTQANASVDSNIVTADVFVVQLPPPVDLSSSIVNVPTLGVDLQWSAAPGSNPTEYIVDRTLAGTSDTVEVAQITDTSFIDTEVNHGNSYTYRVFAVDDVGNRSLPSDTHLVDVIDTAPPSKPIILVPTKAGSVFTTRNGQTSILGSTEAKAEVFLLRNGLVLDSVNTEQEESFAGVGIIKQIEVSPSGRRAFAIEGAEGLLSRGIYVESDDQLVKVTDHNTGIGSGTSFLWVGEQLLFSRFEDTERYLIDPDTLETTDLPGLERQTTLEITPEIFVAEENLLVVRSVDPITQASSRSIINLANETQDNFVYGSWNALSRDSRSLVNIVSSGGVVELAITDWLTGVVENYPIDIACCNLAFESSSFSPDGMSLLVAYANDDSTFSIGELSFIDGSFTVRITELTQLPTNVVWSANGAGFAFIDNDSITSRVRYFDVLSNSDEILLEGTSDESLSLASGINSRAGFIVNIESVAGAYQAEYLTVGQPEAFQFNNVELTEGDNIFSVVSVDGANNISDTSDPIVVERLGLHAPDVAVEAQFAVSAVTPGLETELQVTVSNFGSLVSESVGALITIYGVDGEVATTINKAVPSLAVGAQIQFDLNFTPQLVGEYLVVVAVDSDNLIQESSEANNVAVLSLTVLEELNPYGSLQVNPSLSGNSDFFANQLVAGEFLLLNPSIEFVGTIDIKVQDESGFTVSTLANAIAVELSYGEELLVPFAWNSGVYFAGNYNVVAQLTDSQGNTIDTNIETFSILPTLNVSSAITTDLGAYQSGQSVQVQAQVNTSGSNVLFNDGSINVSIIDSFNVEVYSSTQALGQVLPGESVSSIFNWNTGVLAPDTYVVSLFIVNDAGTVSNSINQFEILPSPPMVSGELNIIETILPKGNDLEVFITASNLGNLFINAFDIEIELFEPETNTVVANQFETVSLLVGETFNTTRVFESNTLTLGSYQVRATGITEFAGNTYEFSLGQDTITFTDSTAPHIEVLSPESGSIVNTQLTPVLVAANDEDSLVTSVDARYGQLDWQVLDLDASGNQGYRLELTEVSDGAVQLFLRAQDQAGNMSNVIEHEFVIDNTAPEIVFENIENGRYYNEPVVPSISANDANFKSITLELDDEIFANGSVVSADGEHILTATAEDFAGNITREIIVFGIDTTPASIAVDGVDDGGLYSSVVTPIIEVGEENIFSIVSTLNGDAFESGTPITNEGSFLLSIVVVDQAGNQSGLDINFEIDNTPPDAPLITSHSDGANLEQNAINIIGTSEAGAIITLINNSDPSASLITLVDTQGQFNFSDIELALGVNNFELIATDAAGNESEPTNITLNRGQGQTVDITPIDDYVGNSVLVWLPPQSKEHHPNCGLWSHWGHPLNYHHAHEDTEALHEMLVETFQEKDIRYMVARTEMDFIEALRSQRFTSVVLVNLNDSMGLPLHVKGAALLELRASIAAGTGALVISNDYSSFGVWRDLLGAKTDRLLLDPQRLDIIESEATYAGSWEFSDRNAIRLRHWGGKRVGTIDYQCSKWSARRCVESAIVINKYGQGDVAVVGFNPAGINDRQAGKDIVAGLVTFTKPDQPAIIPGSVIETNWAITGFDTGVELNSSQSLESGLTYDIALNGQINSDTEAQWTLATNGADVLNLKALIKLPETAGTFEVFTHISSEGAALATDTSSFTVTRSLEDLELELLARLSEASTDSDWFKRGIYSKAEYYVEAAIHNSKGNRWETEYAIYKLLLATFKLKLVGEIELIHETGLLLKAYQRRWYEQDDMLLYGK